MYCYNIFWSFMVDSCMSIYLIDMLNSTPGNWCIAFVSKVIYWKLSRCWWLNACCNGFLSQNCVARRPSIMICDEIHVSIFFCIHISQSRWEGSRRSLLFSSKLFISSDNNSIWGTAQLLTFTFSDWSGHKISRAVTQIDSVCLRLLTGVGFKDLVR